MNVLEILEDRFQLEIVRKIADGGMGLVYEARQKGLDDFEKAVAVKVIREEFSSLTEFRKNFVGEARLVADLIHTNIVQTYHLGRFKNHYYMTMEYVDGVNLEEFLVQHRISDRSVPVPFAVFIVSRLCRGLSYAHQQTDRQGRPLGIVHRDVNPRNVLISYEGDVKLTDFGIAKARNLMYNEEGKVIAGKDEYLSPEQASYGVTDHRSDLFSLGVVLLELLLGKNLFYDTDGARAREKIMQWDPPPPSTCRTDVDGDLDGIVRTALTKDRHLRYPSALEMLTALEYYIYKDGYGPTNEKLGAYLRSLTQRGDDQIPATPLNPDTAY